MNMNMNNDTQYVSANTLLGLDKNRNTLDVKAAIFVILANLLTFAPWVLGWCNPEQVKQDLQMLGL